MGRVAVDPCLGLPGVRQEEWIITARDAQPDPAARAEQVVHGEGRELNQVRRLGVSRVVFECATGNQFRVAIGKVLLDLDEVIGVRLLGGNIKLNDGKPDDAQISRQRIAVEAYLAGIFIDRGGNVRIEYVRGAGIQD